MPDLSPPTLAAIETVKVHGITPDRRDVLQNANTLVLRLTETLVARVVQDTDGPRQGTAWFARENAIAQHLTECGAPIIPLHPDLPPGPHEYSGYPLNFWVYVQSIDEEPTAAQIGKTMYQCHAALQSCTEPLPKLAIITESLDLLDTLRQRGHFPEETLEMLRQHLTASIQILSQFPHQALHGDAHMGNLMNTTQGLLWTDWEDTFAGPVEWDIASIIWNAHLLEDNQALVTEILESYRAEGGQINLAALQQSLIARAAVVTAWYPILYPSPNEDRRAKLQSRLEWLSALPLPL
jgi:hypothetical protein